MASTVEIANQALIRVGSESILSLTDATERARACNASWPFVRREVLRSHSWNSVTTRVKIAELVDAPSWGWDTAYQVPSDSLRILEVDTTYQWRIEGDEILTDGTGELSIRYLKDETDTEQYDAGLTELMVLRLAVEIVERITDSTTKRTELLNDYLMLLSEAKADDGEEQSPSEFEEDSWVTARS